MQSSVVTEWSIGCRSHGSQSLRVCVSSPPVRNYLMEYFCNYVLFNALCFTYHQWVTLITLLTELSETMTTKSRILVLNATENLLTHFYTLKCLLNVVLVMVFCDFSSKVLENFCVLFCEIKVWNNIGDLVVHLTMWFFFHYLIPILQERWGRSYIQIHRRWRRSASIFMYVYLWYIWLFYKLC